MKKEILIVGAGSVGLVFGYYLAKAEFSVTFLIKKKYQPEFETGTYLYNLRKDKQLKSPIHFKKFSTIISFDELNSKKWSQIYFCISSTALHAFDFTAFNTNIKGEPSIIKLQPGIEDLKLLQKKYPSERIIEGMISLISYPCPLPTEKVNQEGTAFWFPPLSSIPFSGEKKRQNEIIRTFKAAGISASSSKDVFIEGLFPSAFLAGFVSSLELAGWKFSELKKSKELLHGIKELNNEIFEVLEQQYSLKRPLIMQLINRIGIFRLLISIAPKLVPFDLETYLKVHYSKVRDQSLFHLNNYKDAGNKGGVSVKNIVKVINILEN
ncbi:MAG: 2-dehydropantoate 2-reductase [Halioglobus sp.]|jgi:2-dehydropantoate 2-reductase